MHAIMLPEVGEVAGRPAVRGLYTAIRAIGNFFAWMLGMAPVWVIYQMFTGNLNMDEGFGWLLPLVLTVGVIAVLMSIFYGLARILPGSLFTPGDWFITMGKAILKNDSSGALAAAKPLAAIHAVTPQEHVFAALAHEVIAESEPTPEHWREALDHLKVSADLGLDSPTLRIEQARSLNGAGDHDAAIALLEQMEHEPDVSSELWVVKALAQVHKGDTDAAVSTMQYLKSIATRWPEEAEAIRTNVDAAVEQLKAGTFPGMPGIASATDSAAAPGTGIAAAPVIEGGTAQWLEKHGLEEDGWRAVYATLNAHPQEREKIVKVLIEQGAGEAGTKAGIRAIDEYRHQNAIATLTLIVLAALFTGGAVFLLASAAVALVEGVFDAGFFDRDITLEGFVQFVSLFLAIACLFGAIGMFSEQLGFHKLLAGHFQARGRTTLINVASICALLIGTPLIALLWNETATAHHELLVNEGIIAPAFAGETSFRIGGLVWQPTIEDRAQLRPMSAHDTTMMREQLDAQLSAVSRRLESLRLFALPEQRGMVVLAAVHSDIELTIESLRDERQLTHEDTLAQGMISSVEELRIDTVAGLPAVRESVTSADGRRGRTTKILLGPYDYVEYTLIVVDGSDFPQFERLYLDLLGTVNPEDTIAVPVS